MLIETVRALGPGILACREEIERERRLPDALVAEMRAAGLFRLQTPREFGGYELGPAEFMAVVEEVAKADGSAGWVVNVGNAGMLCGSHDETVARAVFGANPDVILGASFPPRGGRATPEPGGYRLSGRWTFVSGCLHADWLNFGFVVMDGERPRQLAGGTAEVRRALIPASAAQICDTWHVGGLRGTGSHDVTVSDLFVPEAYAPLVGAWSGRRGPLWRFPGASWLGLGFVSVGLGIARTAIETLKDLAGAKRPFLATGLLRERASVQVDVARAEALLRSARGFLHASVGEIWQGAVETRPATLEARALLRAAVVQAAESSATVVDLMYRAGGATSIFETCLLERCFRDVHTLTQQITVAPQNWEPVGRVLLGMEADSPLI